MIQTRTEKKLEKRFTTPHSLTIGQLIKNTYIATFTLYIWQPLLVSKLLLFVFFFFTFWQVVLVGACRFRFLVPANFAIFAGKLANSVQEQKRNA